MRRPVWASSVSLRTVGRQSGSLTWSLLKRRPAHPDLEAPAASCRRASHGPGPIDPRLSPPKAWALPAYLPNCLPNCRAPTIRNTPPWRALECVGLSRCRLTQPGSCSGITPKGPGPKNSRPCPSNPTARPGSQHAGDRRGCSGAFPRAPSCWISRSPKWYRFLASHLFLSPVLFDRGLATRSTRRSAHLHGLLPPILSVHG